MGYVFQNKSSCGRRASCVPKMKPLWSVERADICCVGTPQLGKFGFGGFELGFSARTSLRGDFRHRRAFFWWLSFGRSLGTDSFRAEEPSSFVVRGLVAFFQKSPCSAVWAKMETLTNGGAERHGFCLSFAEIRQNVTKKQNIKPQGLQISLSLIYCPKKQIFNSARRCRQGWNFGEVRLHSEYDIFMILSDGRIFFFM